MMTTDMDPEHVNSFELETWSRCADSYLKGFAGMTLEALPFLIEAADICEGKRMLDVGSGPGHICGALNEMGCEMSGIDFSDSMVGVAKENYPEVDFRQGNAEELPFEAGFFDTVISNFVVHHLARPNEVFSEVSRVLKLGSVFAYSVFADPEAQSSVGAFFAAVGAHHSIDELPHGPLFGVTDLDVHSAMLKAGGLENPEFEFRKFIWQVETPDPVYDSFRVWGNIDALPPETQKRIKETTYENLEAFRSDSGYSFPHEVLIAKAVSP